MRLLTSGIAAGITNGMFWFIYSMTGNIGYSIGITAGASMGIIATLKMLGKRKLR